MSAQQLLFGLLEFLVTVLISFFLTFSTYQLLLKLTPHFDQEKKLKQKNASVGLVLGSILLGQAIVVRQAIYPVMAVIQLYITGTGKNFAKFAEFLALGAGYIVLAGVLAILCILLSFWLFDKLTPGIDQYQEVRDNNLAIAVFMALFIIGISLLISSGVSALVRALIPFPNVGSIPLG
jgi:putative membrane protein